MSKKLNYDEAYELYGDYVYQTVLKYSGRNKELAEDISQDVFLELYLDIDKTHIRNMKNWLHTLAKNATLNENIRRKRLKMECEMEDPDSEFPTEMDLETGYLEKEAEEETHDLVYDILCAVKKKNARWYTAMYRCYYMKIPREIVAREMGISVNVLDGLLHRSKRWVEKEFGITFKESRQD